jgi:hypothetical protein
VSTQLTRAVAGFLVLLAMGVSAAYSANISGLRDRYPPPAVAAEG